MTARFRPAPLLALAVVFIMPASGGLAAQVPDRLSLDEALSIALGNNPAWLATRNDVEVDDWNVRAAWGALTPQIDVGGNIGWLGSGEQNLGGLIASDLGVTQQPNYYSSGYRASMSWGLNGQNWYGPENARAGRAITEAQVEAARVNLESRVTALYLDVLRQQDGVELAGQQLERAEFNLRIARANAEIGTATLLDVRQAEVQVGRSEVARLQARNALETAYLRLMQQLGVRLSEVRPELTTDFGLVEPTFELDALYAEAVADNPTLNTRRRAVESTKVGVKIARSSYFPSLSLNTGISGFSREASNTDFLIQQAQSRVAGQIQSCQSTNDLYRRLADPLPPIDCSQFVFTDAQRQSIIDGNDVFPFDFTQSPPSATLSISIPVFQGLSRQRNLEQSQTQLRDAELQVREQELALEADLSVNLAQVRTAWQSAQLEEQNQRFADEQLRLARERYQLGAIPFVDLIEAETVKAQADRDRLNAVYAYHDAITNLEAVVGRSLRDR